MTNFIPQKGDHVTADGQNGIYLVYLIDASIEAADLVEIKSGVRLASIPWNTLKSVYEAALPPQKSGKNAVLNRT
jgi:hypothetical protein